jgi:hypothetical protein
VKNVIYEIVIFASTKLTTLMTKNINYCSACGQIGAELTAKLRARTNKQRHGASDIRKLNDIVKNSRFLGSK